MTISMCSVSLLCIVFDVEKPSSLLVRQFRCITIEKVTLIPRHRRWQVRLLAVQEEDPIEENREGVQEDGPEERRAKTITHLQEAADGRAESPAEVPGHAFQARHCGARRGLDPLHDESLVNRDAHI